MRKHKHTTLKLARCAYGKKGFSLVEVALAVGIVAFAFVSIFALLPAGLNIFRETMNTSVGSQITQRVLNEAQESDFESLIKDSSWANGAKGTANETILAKNLLDPAGGSVRWFDEQGNELTSATGSIYHVLTRIMPTTALPKTGTSTSDNIYIATITVQVANNPNQKALAFESGTPSDYTKPLRNLWSGATTTNSTLKSIAMMTASTVVARK